MDLSLLIQEEIKRFWSRDVRILGAWPVGAPSVAAVIYHRALDPKNIWGRLAVFSPSVADGTLEGFARDIAINMAEPVGNLAAVSRMDCYGVSWLALPDSEPLPEIPRSILAEITAD